jgi:dihydrodipicolinate synthase/N-acetylneuraminate lyase
LNTKITSRLSGVWSAAPTPLTDELKVAPADVERMVARHIGLGVNGLFLAGTCGEGPWLPATEKSRLMKSAVAAAAGRLPIAVQVSDNSAARILENIEQAVRDGADIAVVAPPTVLFNADERRIFNLYAEVLRESPLPIGLYDLGKRREFSLTIDRLADLLQDPKVVFLKDSSSCPQRREMALRVRKSRSGLGLFNGDEFDCVTYLESGYDGLMLGGAAVIARLATFILEAVADGRQEEAQEWQGRMTGILHAIYGGKNFPCWLAGLKRTLVGLGVFSTWRNFPDYELTKECSQDIDTVLSEQRDLLLPALDPFPVQPAP